MTPHVDEMNNETNDLVILIHETLVEHTSINSAEKLGSPTCNLITNFKRQDQEYFRFIFQRYAPKL